MGRMMMMYYFIILLEMEHDARKYRERYMLI